MQEKEDAHLSEWDRFARTEYVRLAMEEEGEEERNDSARGGGGWESSLEAPFWALHAIADSRAFLRISSGFPEDASGQLHIALDIQCEKAKVDWVIEKYCILQNIKSQATIAFLGF